VVDTVGTKGGFVITPHGQYGTCTINLGNVNAVELEELYREQRRNSFLGPNAGSERAGELSWYPSTGGSSEHLSLRSNKFGCLNTSKYWWSPKFNSDVLDAHLKLTVVEFLRGRFRLAQVFIGICTLLWIVVFSVNIPFSPAPEENLSRETLEIELAISSVEYNRAYVFGGLVLLGCTALLLSTTFTSYYAKFARSLSVLFSVILMCASFSLAVSQKYTNAGGVQSFLSLSFVAQFALTAVSILVIFTLSRLPIWVSVVLTVVYLIILEGLVGYSTYGYEIIVTPTPAPNVTSQVTTAAATAVAATTTESPASSLPHDIYVNSSVGRIILYIGLILSSVSASYMLQVRQLATFWKIAQCVLSQKAMELERDLKEKTILSMMPKHFADELLNVEVQMAFMIKKRFVQESQGSMDPMYQSILAPFKICSMDDVSILFADIVDFTTSRFHCRQLVECFL